MLTYSIQTSKTKDVDFFLKRENNMFRTRPFSLEYILRQSLFIYMDRKYFILVKMYFFLRRDGRVFSCIVEVTVNCGVWDLKHLLSVQIGDTG